ncbi:MAG: trehalose-phosphatase [Candidatus Omnitrophota bacterium]|nr:MAG: trehalose-phosphatase [Candidatus Omnitrophota bacterium]
MCKYSYGAVIFDMDGVITKTDKVHAQAWKLIFDEYLCLRQKRDNQDFVEFSYKNDYLNYVDGKPRLKGIKSFLASRGIELDLGNPDDSPDTETIYGLGNKKNLKFREVLNNDGVGVYEPTVNLVNALKQKGIRVGIVSSSKNCRFILETAGIMHLFETRLDGVIAEELKLEGKPEGDIFVTAALNLGVSPARSVVIEDAISGVQAGRNGGFALVVGVARSDNAAELNKNGADVTVTDLSVLNVDWIQNWFDRKPLPLFNVWDQQQQVTQAYAEFNINDTRMYFNPDYLRAPKKIFCARKKPVFFLDYDGTLTPIVDRPELALISDEMRNLVKLVSQKFTTAIVSGRMREDVENLLGIEGLFYAGSHGFDILGNGVTMLHPQAQQAIAVIDKIIPALLKQIGNIKGVIIEQKKFSVAVHYRLVDTEYLARIKDIVNKVVQENNSLRLMHGKKVFEILPAIEWNKGMALRWIMQALNITWDKYVMVYIGDDTTDEDAFRMVRGRGCGILVSDAPKSSSAQFYLSSPEEVKKMFELLLEGN